MTVGKFTKTVIEDWNDRDCCRLDFRGYDVRCPFFGDASLWDDEGPSEDINTLAEYIRSRPSLEGIILGGEPLHDRDLFATLRKVKVRKLPMRLETYGNHPDGLDDIAGAMMIDSICLILPAVPGSPRYGEACPGSNETKVKETLKLLPDLDIKAEIQVIAVPGFTGGEDIKRLARGMGENTNLVIRQFDPNFCPDKKYASTMPFTKSEGTSLCSIAKTYTRKVGIRGF